MDIIELRAIVVKIVLAVANDAGIKINEITDDENLLILLDSMDVVSLIMETESEIFLRLGKSVSFANEYTFDMEKSPLSNMAKWVKFVSVTTGIINE